MSTWESVPSADATARIAAAFDLLWQPRKPVDKATPQNLTESSPPGIMSHDSQGHFPLL